MSIKCVTVKDFDQQDTPDYLDLVEEDDVPSDVITKTIVKSTTFINGKEMRFYKVTYFRNGRLYKVEYYKFNQLHSDIGPAYIQYFRNSDEIKAEIYFKDGLKHRPEEDGPAEMIMKMNRKGRYTARYRYYEYGELLE